MCYNLCINWNNFCLFSCATTGEGLFEGLQWLSQNVKKRQQKVFSFICSKLTLYLFSRALTCLHSSHPAFVSLLYPIVFC
jgi:hypothetical protein